MPATTSKGLSIMLDTEQPIPSPVARGRGRANRPACGLPAWIVDAAHRELSEQRAFRINQLSQLAAARPGAVDDPVRNEVHAKLIAGARAVLSDIDCALRRIEQGTYGSCLHCGESLSLGRLTALPMASLCGSCQRIEAMDTSEPGAADA